MAISIFNQGQFTDLAPLFEFTNRKNFLLANLGIFDTVHVKHADVMLKEVVETGAGVNLPKSRYSSDHNVSGKPSALFKQVTLPWFPRSAIFTPQDVANQARITGVMAVEENEADLAQFYLEDHARAFRNTREEQFAMALFQGKSFDTAEFDTYIDWADVYGQEQIKQTVDLTSTTTNPADVLEDVVSEIESKADGLASDIGRIIVFCTPTFYNGFRRNPAFKETYTYTNVFDPRNPVVQQSTLVDNDSFDIAGTKITLVKVSQKEVAKYLPENGAVVLPMFTGDSKGAYSNFVGAASGNFEVLGGTEEFYSAAWRSYDRKAYHVESENSSLPVNRVFGFSAALSSA